MRELSVTVVHGLTALHALMRSGGPVRIGPLARMVRIEASSLRPILARLVHAGLAAHHPGRGYALARAPGEIRLENVISALDSRRTPTAPCGGDFDSCPSRASCVLSVLCRKADEKFTETIRSFTLDELKEASPDLPNCVDPAVRKRSRA